MTQFRERHPASLKLVALLDCPEMRTVELASDYSLFTTERGRFVGYGLDFNGRYGNLPFPA